MSEAESMSDAEFMPDAELMPELSNIQLFVINCISLFEVTMTYEVSAFKFWMKELWNIRLKMSMQNEL